MDGMEQETIRTVNAFDHENVLMHYGYVNKRSMIMLISVCVTFVLITAIFVAGYTIRETIREQNWLNTLEKIMTNSPAYTEVEADGIHQQPNP